MSKRSAPALLIAALTTAMLIAAIPAATAGTASDESQFVSKINAARAANGRGSLKVMSDLTALARKQSARMAARGEIFHNPNLASDVSGNWTNVGENVGAGPDPSSLHQAFMDSPEHRANILDRVYNQVGIGVVMGGDGTMYVTEVFATRASRSVRAAHTVRPRTRAHHASARAHVQSSPVKPAAVAPQAHTQETNAGDTQSVDLLARIVGLDRIAS